MNNIDWILNPFIKKMLEEVSELDHKIITHPTDDLWDDLQILRQNSDDFWEDFWNAMDLFLRDKLKESKQ